MMLFNKIRKYNRERINRRRYAFKINGECIWHDRQKHAEKCCVVLAGYKPFLWDCFFERLVKFIPDNIDVCIVSSGVHNEKLMKIAENNNWSYLSMKRNCVSLAQNRAIYLHSSAKFIYKIDEDIFLTKNCFENLYDTYNAAENGKYYVGFVAPLIPINGYGHVRILQKLGLENIWKEKFGEIKMAGSAEFARPIEKNPQAAKFFWGDGDVVPSIDELNRQFQKELPSFGICPIRFSIGCILFSRSVWEHMGMFTVPKKGNGMGLDEEQLCAYCVNYSRVMVVSENTVVGHLSFGAQNKEMEAYYLSNADKFKIIARDS